MFQEKQLEQKKHEITECNHSILLLQNENTRICKILEEKGFAKLTLHSDFHEYRAGAALHAIKQDEFLALIDAGNDKQNAVVYPQKHLTNHFRSRTHKDIPNFPLESSCTSPSFEDSPRRSPLIGNDISSMSSPHIVFFAAPPSDEISKDDLNSRGTDTSELDALFATRIGKAQ